MDEIVEVVKCGAPRANNFLKAGYVLILVSQETVEKKMQNDQPYIQKNVVFVMGRPRDVEHYVEQNRGQVDG